MFLTNIIDFCENKPITGSNGSPLGVYCCTFIGMKARNINLASTVDRLPMSTEHYIVEKKLSTVTCKYVAVRSLLYFWLFGVDHHVYIICQRPV